MTSTSLSLLACSGAVDSTALVDILYKEGKRFAIAHCNFNLRGKDSIEDEKFVRVLAEKYNVDFFCENFNIEAIPQKSIQMIARELRYEWLFRIANNFDFSHIVTGHHVGDVFETTMLNLCRGTGIHGLVNMYNDRNPKIVRPLLERGLTKKNLIEYCKKHSLQWREDLSNSKDDYKRNLIRNKVTPLLKEINPILEKTFFNTLGRMKDVQNVWEKNKKRVMSEYFFQAENFMRIDIEKLKTEEGYLSILYEYLSEYGFSYLQVRDFMRRDHISGKQIFNETHTLLTQYNSLILCAIDNNRCTNIHEVFLKNANSLSTNFSTYGMQFMIEKLSPKEVNFSNNENIAYLDLDKIAFPLYISSPQRGDKFIPLGMRKSKKISDFFIDEKVPLHSRSGIKILKTKNEIVWVIGHRISEKCKVDESTKSVLKISLDVS